MDAKKQDMELEHNNVVVLMIDIMFSSIATGTGYLCAFQQVLSKKSLEEIISDTH